MALKQLSDGGPDGTTIGQGATDKVAFFGQTPNIQPSGAGQADIISTASVSVSSTQWGYTTSTQATGIVTLLRAIRAALIPTTGVGLISGA